MSAGGTLTGSPQVEETHRERADTTGGEAPRLAGVVVHWHDEPSLAVLAASWPADPRFPLVVVDNGSVALEATLAAARARLGGALTVLAAARDTSFASGANRGLAATTAPFALLLNPDAAPRPGALDALLDGFAAWPDAIGLAPRLLGLDGRSQHRWQLRPLPRPGQLVVQCLLLPGLSGPAVEPAAGTRVAQPAAAALALRRAAVLELGGFDEGYPPAWFEDVDLARRLADAGARLRYWPAAEVVHRLGGSVSTLGYRRFLDAYYRNLVRYLDRHHGTRWAVAARLALVAGMGLRLLALPLRRPRRARSRREAAAALAAVGWSALRGWPASPVPAAPAVTPSAP